MCSKKKKRDSPVSIVYEVDHNQIFRYKIDFDAFLGYVKVSKGYNHPFRVRAPSRDRNRGKNYWPYFLYEK